MVQNQESPLNRAHVQPGFTRFFSKAISFVLAFIISALELARTALGKVLETRAGPPALRDVQRSLKQLADDNTKLKQDMDLALARLEHFEVLEGRFGLPVASAVNAPVVDGLAVDPDPLTASAAIKVLNEATGRSTAHAVEWAANCLYIEGGGDEPKSVHKARRLERIMKLGALDAVVHALDVMTRSGTQGAVYQCLRVVELMGRDEDSEAVPSLPPGGPYILSGDSSMCMVKSSQFQPRHALAMGGLLRSNRCGIHLYPLSCLMQPARILKF